MSKEELEKEAIAKYKTGSYSQLHPDHYAFIHGYLAGAEPREKRIEELEQQIEKLKCCYNCSKWNDGECEESPKSKTFFCADFKCDKWECIE